MTDPAIGITTTVPVEILFAAGRRPVDLNNLFIADPEARERLLEAEHLGLPQSCCAWIKGIHSTVRRREIREVVGVIEGDCSETGAMLELLEAEGLRVLPFGFPHSRETDDLQRAMERLAAALGTTLAAAEAMKTRLDRVRSLGRELDRLAWERGTVTSGELFDALLLLTDFGGDLETAAARLAAQLAEAKEREANTHPLRLACLGVPTIWSDLWGVIERCGARVVDHEVPRQFARIDALECDLVESYRRYTYPYATRHRLADIEHEIATRRIDGVIHYVQSFCHRQITDRLLRDRLSIPILTLEGDRPGRVDERTKTRIEAFIEQVGG